MNAPLPVQVYAPENPQIGYVLQILLECMGGRKISRHPAAEGGNIRIIAAEAEVEIPYLPEPPLSQIKEWLSALSRRQSFTEIDLDAICLHGAAYMLLQKAWLYSEGMDGHRRAHNDFTFDFPWIDQMAIILLKRLGLSHAGHRKPAEISVDIDFPWRFAYRSKFRNDAAFLKSVFQRNFAEAKANILTRLHLRKDPYDTYAELQEWLGPQRAPIYFLLWKRQHPHDGPNAWRKWRLKSLAKKLRAAGAQVGIHPSYASTDSPEDFIHEIEDFAHSTVQASPLLRNHFLRGNPHKYRRWLIEKTMIRHDYTCVLPRQPGYLLGTGSSIPWFDVERGEVTDLWLHPSCCMDRTLLPHGPEMAERILEEYYRQAIEFGFTFRLLIHNNTLSDFGEWRGWKAFWKKVITHYA